ncbi:MAG: tetratricopeptide repeat-containing sensor histidine kinase, partial [Bacteroidota bacterium]
MKMIVRFVVLLLFLIVYGSAQSQPDWRQGNLLPDSIRTVLDTVDVAEAPLYVYRYGHKAINVDKGLGIKVYQLGISMAAGLEDQTYYSYGFYYLARFYQRQQKIDSARLFFLKAAEVATQNEDSSLLKTTYKRIALDYLNQSNFTQSNEYYKAALKYTADADTADLLLYRNKVALNFVTSGNLDSALYYQLLSEPMIAQIKTPKAKGEWYWNLAIMYKKREQPKPAVKYFKEAIEVFSSCKEVVDCNVYQNASTLLLASTFVDKASYDSAEFYFDKLAGNSAYMSSPQVFGFYLHQSRLYEKTGQYQKAIKALQTSNGELSKQQNLNNQFGYYSNTFNIGKMYVKLEEYKKAKPYLEQSVDWFEQNNNASSLSEAYENLALANYQLRNYRDAYDLQQKRVQLTDSLEKIETDKNLQELNTKYEVADREKAIALLRAKTENQALVSANQQRNVTILLVVLAIVVLIAVLIFVALRRFRILNEQLNLQNERIRQTEAVKTRWFVNISHELKTPLTLIKGPVNKILSEDTVNSVARDDLELVDRNVEKLTGIVHEILDISRLEDGKLVLNEKVIFLGRVIRNVASAFDSTVTARNIQLKVDIAEDFPVKVDEIQLMKVLTNYLSNAIKYSPNDSEIEVSLKMVQDQIVVSVRDQG